MKRYVLCYAHKVPHCFSHEVLLIEKRKPAWQAGLWNLPGGSIEDSDDSPEDAAVRELWEETGIRADRRNVRVYGRLEGPGYEIFSCFCPYQDWFAGRKQEVILGLTPERVFFQPIADALTSPLLIPNLRIIIPLMNSRVEGWCIRGTTNDTVENQWAVEFESQKVAA